MTLASEHNDSNKLAATTARRQYREKCRGAEPRIMTRVDFSVCSVCVCMCVCVRCVHRSCDASSMLVSVLCAWCYWQCCFTYHDDPTIQSHSASRYEGECSAETPRIPSQSLYHLRVVCTWPDCHCVQGHHSIQRWLTTVAASPELPRTLSHFQLCPMSVLLSFSENSVASKWCCVCVCIVSVCGGG